MKCIDVWNQYIRSAANDNKHSQQIPEMYESMCVPLLPCNVEICLKCQDPLTDAINIGPTHTHTHAYTVEHHANDRYAECMRAVMRHTAEHRTKRHQQNAVAFLFTNKTEARGFFLYVFSGCRTNIQPICSVLQGYICTWLDLPLLFIKSNMCTDIETDFTGPTGIQHCISGGHQFVSPATLLHPHRFAQLLFAIDADFLPIRSLRVTGKNLTTIRCTLFDDGRRRSWIVYADIRRCLALA